MARPREVTEKKPPVVEATDSSIKNINLHENNTTEEEQSQVFQAINGDYKPVYDTKVKGTHWNFIVYEESAPADWREQLRATGLKIAISPHHNSDKNPDGALKKSHYHIIVSYDQGQRYSAVIGLRRITCGPYPIKCESIRGSYAYLTHQQNPEKYQYDKDEIDILNGFEIPTTKLEVEQMKRELKAFAVMNNIKEYTVLSIRAESISSEHARVVDSHTIYFTNICKGIRYAYKDCLMAIYNTDLITDEEREVLGIKLMDMMDNSEKI